MKIKKILRNLVLIILCGVLIGGVSYGTQVGLGKIFGNDSQTLTTTASSSNVTNTSTTSTGVSALAKKCLPSIVSITTISVEEVQNYFSMWGRNGYSQTQETTSCGSGIIVSKGSSTLSIVTNYHVVEGAKTVSVTFNDDQTYEASIKGYDSDNDIAVLSVKLSDVSSSTLSSISVATINSSSNLEVGSQVVAIGNALGYGQSVTTGIISATDRTISTSSSSDNNSSYYNYKSEQTSSTSSSTSKTYIQTDAAINPGNSGGALFNMNGEVIGINTAKVSSTDTEGMGYAIPMSRAQSIINKLINQ